MLTLPHLCRKFHMKCKQECNVHYIECKTKDSKINLFKLKLTLPILLLPKSTNKPLYTVGLKQPPDFKCMVIPTYSCTCVKNSCFSFRSVVFILGQLFTAAYR